MPGVTKEKLIAAFEKLGTFMINPDEVFENAISAAERSNAWFTRAEIEKALLSLHNMLNEHDLKKWFKDIEIAEHPRVLGLILAGNIPLVGFHDVLCVLATGHIAQIKLSSSDEKLLPALLNELIKMEPALARHVQYVDRLEGFDAIIATGSDNTSRYFDYYFGRVPNIIRKNRNSIAVLTGEESPEDIQSLGHDIFDYFGLGCRSVSKLYIPDNYNIENFFKPIEGYHPVINHFKYNNNYDYNKSIYLINLVPHFDNGFLLLKEDALLSSPLAALYYEKYSSLNQLEEILASQRENIQCIVSSFKFKKELPVVAFGQSQHPKLWNYADNINTNDFLMNLNS